MLRAAPVCSKEGRPASVRGDGAAPAQEAWRQHLLQGWCWEAYVPAMSRPRMKVAGLKDLDFSHSVATRFQYKPRQLPSDTEPCEEGSPHVANVFLGAEIRCPRNSDMQAEGTQRVSKELDVTLRQPPPSVASRESGLQLPAFLTVSHPGQDRWD